jgi:hypothetical protein
MLSQWERIRKAFIGSSLCGSGKIRQPLSNKDVLDMKGNRERASFIAPPVLSYHEGSQIATCCCERGHSILLMRLIYIKILFISGPSYQFH